MVEKYTNTASGIAPCVLPISSWPEILVGPIVRRVDVATTVAGTAQKDSVAIFLVLSRARHARVHVYEGTDPGSATRTPKKSSAYFTPVGIGDRMWVVMPRVEDIGLKKGQVYGYDIELADSPTGPNQTPNTTLSSAGLLDDPKYPLGYVKGKLPSFVVPEVFGKLRAAHASCRKPHGGGPDALSTLDLVLEKNISDLNNRPQQLFLTGDQIYSDDVAVALLNTLSPLGEALLGWREKLPLDQADKDPTTKNPITQLDFTHPSVAPGKRSDFLFTQLKKPKTHYAENHLLFFGDFCAMYVMAWSPAIWKKDANGYPTMTAFSAFSNPRERDTLTGKMEVLAEGISDAQSGVTNAQVDETALDAYIGGMVSSALEEWDTTTPLLDYAKTLPRIRRALANIATYMMFDDHEVTDDWYLNGELWLRFRGTKVGRRLLRNALAAYAVFQDWGNRPAEYAAPGSYQDLIAKLVAANTSGINGTNPTCCDSLLDVGPPTTSGWLSGGKNMLATKPANGRVEWNWSIAWEEHVVCSLDTRTHRYFPESKLLAGSSDALALAQIFAPDNISRMVASGSGAVLGLLEEGQTKLNAHLIEKSEMAKQVSLGTAQLPLTGRSPRTLFVISPAPVFGFLIVEMLQRAMVIKDGAQSGPEETGAEARDNEPWIGSPQATANLLGYLSAQPIIFLSGDVHYAYSTLVKWSVKGVPKQKYLQLCSSAAKNSEPLTEVLALTDHITDAWGKGGLSGAWRVANLLYGVSGDVGGVIFNADPDAQSRFVEDIEDKVFSVLGSMTGESIGDPREIPESLGDQIAYDFVKYTKHPWRIVLGDTLVDVPTTVAKFGEITNDPVAGMGCEPTSLEDNRAADRIQLLPRPGHWYKDFQAGARSWLTPFSSLDKQYIANWNYISVGHANMGLISVYADAGKPVELVHELLWYTNLTTNGAPVLQGAESISTCPLLYTRHTQVWPPPP